MKSMPRPAGADGTHIDANIDGEMFYRNMPASAPKFWLSRRSPE